LRAVFPRLAIDVSQVLATFSGLRAIVVAPGEENRPPSAMGRDSALWVRPGLVGITGGKLTTHRATALEVLREVAKQGVAVAAAADAQRSPAAATTRLQGRLGDRGAAWVAARPADEQRPLLGTPYTLAELRWSMQFEQVHRLDDLLMRRVRLGLVAPNGGVALLTTLEAPCRDDLGWSAARWADEAARYRENWVSRHAPPADNRRP